MLFKLSTILLETKNIFKSYFKDSVEIPVLKDINLKIFVNDKLAITGKSGSGKSTLLNLLGTLDYPTKGEIYFKDGGDITSLKEDILSKFRNKHIGFVFQFHYLIKELTAIENVMLPGLISDSNKKKVEERAKFLLYKLDIFNRMNHRLLELSGGEQQRVAIARALINSPDLLLADEPTGNLDTYSSKKTLDLLDNLQEEFGLTFVIATHNNEIADKCHRRVVLIDGNIKEIL